MQKTTNADTVKGASASEKSSQANYTNNSAISKEEIHRSPIRLQRQPNQLPVALKHLHQWCLSSHTKQPLTATGYKMDVTNPSDYLSFDDATAASANLTCAAGVGFILTGTNIVTVDVDHCYNNGKFSQLAEELMNQLPTYTEFSQSSTGLHFIYLDNGIPPDFSGRKGVVEIYSNKRYIALTGWKITGSTADLTVLNGMTKRLLDTYFPNTGYNSSADFQTTLEQHSYPPVQSDEAVLQSLQTNQKFQQLYAGNISGYPSQSEADGALMLILATATALNATQMRRLFSQSALGQRNKWINRSWYQDYLITGAIKFVESRGDDDEMETEYVKFSDYGQHQFEKDQSQYATQSSRKTGFPTIDKYMGFPPGVYCLTAVSSAGKTAFSIQLGQQLAQQGESVIYVGYETTPLEVYSRILTRTMKLLNPYSSFSAQDIRKNLCEGDSYYRLAQQQIYQLPFGFLKVSPKDDVDKLLQKLHRYIDNHPDENPPVVIVDYIQIIPHIGEVKNMLDVSVPKIKHFQQSTGTTFLIISSANRASYHHDMGVESFKESGVIEFSADVIWVLQYSAVDNRKNLSSAELEIEKSRAPRKMTLKCLKNRFGTDYKVHFNYHSKFDWFVEQENFDVNDKGWKAAVQI